jgi:hypothetical protein
MQPLYGSPPAVVFVLAKHHFFRKSGQKDDLDLLLISTFPLPFLNVQPDDPLTARADPMPGHGIVLKRNSLAQRAKERPVPICKTA